MMRHFRLESMRAVVAFAISSTSAVAHSQPAADPAAPPPAPIAAPPPYAAPPPAAPPPAPWTVQPPYSPPATYPGGGYAYGPPPPPAPPPLAPERACCLWSLRYDPFDLIYRRVTFEGEVAWGGLPFSAEVTGSWIFASPTEGLDQKGFDLGFNLAWYPGGEPLRGFWVKAHAELESFDATLSRTAGNTPIGKPNPDLCDADSATGTCKKHVASPIFGVLLGSTQVFGRRGGFAVSGGFGVGAAVADSTSLEVLPCTSADVAAGDAHCPLAENGGTALGFRMYDESARIRLLGTLAIGVAF
ncbi:MAG: hypothetical protein EXR75_08445 [Myxococcales bacterium]|nr:hypothetical protein [Myxococcales bacterium]